MPLFFVIPCYSISKRNVGYRSITSGGRMGAGREAADWAMEMVGIKNFDHCNVPNKITDYVSILILISTSCIAKHYILITFSKAYLKLKKVVLTVT